MIISVFHAAFVLLFDNIIDFQIREVQLKKLNGPQWLIVSSFANNRTKQKVFCNLNSSLSGRPGWLQTFT